MINAAQMLKAYARGIFPMAESAEDPRLNWYDPPYRGILPVGGIHVSRSLLRELRRGGWSARIEQDFDAAVMACAHRPATWINEPLARLYHQLHLSGNAHAITILKEGDFAGCIFGLTLGGAFFGESMMSARSNGSKMALLWTSHHLARCGFRLFDTQLLTPHLARMGAIEISRAEYRQRLDMALTCNADFLGAELPSADQLWQEITQTS